MLSVAILGRLRLEIDAKPVDAGGPRQRAVLVRLQPAAGHSLIDTRIPARSATAEASS